MAFSENLQNHFEKQPVDPKLIERLDIFGIDPQFKKELQVYLQKFEGSVAQILEDLEDPRVQGAIQEGNQMFVNQYNSVRHKRRNLIFQAANDNNQGLQDVA